MNLDLIAVRYNTPESLSRLETAKLESLYADLDMEHPLKRIAYSAQGVSPALLTRLATIRGNVLQEIKRRDALPTGETTRAELPDFQKIHLAKDAKTDMMRIIDALYELKFFQDSDGLALTREKVFALFGNLFEGGFTGFAQALSQSYDKTSKETNSAIFDKMKGKVEKKMEQTQERAKKK